MCQGHCRLRKDKDFSSSSSFGGGGGGSGFRDAERGGVARTEGKHRERKECGRKERRKLCSSFSFSPALSFIPPQAPPTDPGTHPPPPPIVPNQPLLLPAGHTAGSSWVGHNAAPAEQDPPSRTPLPQQQGHIEDCCFTPLAAGLDTALIQQGRLILKAPDPPTSATGPDYWTPEPSPTEPCTRLLDPTELTAAGPCT